MKTLLDTDSEYVCHIEAPCFSFLTPEEVQLVQASRTQVLFRKGENLTKQGAFASYVLFVTEGSARQYIEGDGQRNFNLRIILPGEFVGLSSVFGKNTFAYSAVALTECRAFIVEKPAITQVIKTNGDFAFNIIRRYCEWNSGLYGTIEHLVYRQMNGRMADTLLYLEGIRQSEPTVFQLLSRKDLAEFAGTSVENAVKLLKAFEADGLISLQDKDILILDAPRLAGIAARG